MGNSSGQHGLTKPFDENGHGVAPLSQAGRRNVLYQDDGVTTFDATALPVSSGTWRRSMIIDVRRWRRLVLIAKYLPGASAVSGLARIVPFASNEDGIAKGQAAPPDKDADNWTPLSTYDGTVTAAALAGTFAGTVGLVPTPASTFGTVLAQQLAIKIAASTAATNINGVRIALDVNDARWMQIQAQEAGDDAHPGTLRLFYALTT